MLRTLASVLMVAALPAAAAESISGAARVIDGDSFEIGKTVVRLWGIDAPEPDQFGHDLPRRRCHHQAVSAEAVRHEEPLQLRVLADHRVVVGRHLVQPGPPFHELRVLERGHAAHEVGPEIGEPA